jgi:hypothetical protein
MKKLLLILMILGILIPISSCKKTDNKNKQKVDSVKISDNVDVQTFYLVPSPEDVFGFADDKSLVFNSEFLNPVENLDKYNDTKLQEFNFGVYSADLAYSASASKNDETVKYLNVVRSLSQKIGLADVFNESLVSRIEHVTPQKDSLIALSNDTYFDIIRYLERNNRPATLAIMAAGGWLECMYLVVNQLDYSKGNPTLQKVADQKLIISNLMKFLEQNQKNPNVKSIMDDFKNIFDIYNQIKVVTSDEITNTSDRNEKIIVVGGHTRFDISKEQYDNLKKSIISTRNKLTLNAK